MSKYIRTTQDVWELYVNYGQGWEYELGEYSRKEIRDRVKEYRQNLPRYATKVVKKREKISEPIPCGAKDAFGQDIRFN